MDGWSMGGWLFYFGGFTLVLLMLCAEFESETQFRDVLFEAIAL